MQLSIKLFKSKKKNLNEFLIKSLRLHYFILGDKDSNKLNVSLILSDPRSKTGYVRSETDPSEKQ